MCANKYSSGVQRHIAFRTYGTLLVGCLVLSWLREGRRAGFWLNCFKCSLCLIQILFLTPYEYKGHTQRKLQLFFPFPLEMLFMGHISVKGSIYLLDLLRILLLSLQKVLQGFLNLIHIQGGLNSSTDKHASQILLFLGSVKNSCFRAAGARCVFINKISDNWHWPLSTRFRKAVCFQGTERSADQPYVIAVHEIFLSWIGLPSMG